MKPILRGHFHQAAFYTFLGACAMLLAACKTKLEFISILIYSLGVVGLMGVSALYHIPQWMPKQRAWMRRLDHSFIFILIAATGTPMGALALNEQNGKNFLITIWIAASIGVLQSLFWVKAPKWLVAVLCLITGWLAAPYMSELSLVLGSTNITLLMAGGVVYTMGAAIYALKHPNPYPKIFGYHEIFHVLVIIGALLHFVVIRSLLLTM
jgi:hemolysin III